LRPDGDAEVDDAVVEAITVPDCERCGGMLMPDVVFFGGTVPRERVETTVAALHNCDGLLVAGSSLQVFSGFRFCRLAHQLGKPITIINRGKTRADDLATLKVEEDAGEVLDQLASKAGKA
jgi:NAD-dependent SIR2 family protein deacetylase